MNTGPNRRKKRLNEPIVNKFDSKEKGSIRYTLRKSRRAKHIRLTVRCDGAVTVTSPSGIEEKAVEKFVSDKKEWIISKILYFRKKFKDIVFLRSGRKDYLKHKGKALSVIEERLNFYNRVYRFPFGKISVKKHKRLWGSCSRAKNMNFNYKIILLPERLRDYVIVHELCHLARFDHSKDFWDLVAMVFPDHKEIRKELRRIR